MFFANSCAMKQLIFVIVHRRLIPSAMTIRFTTTAAAAGIMITRNEPTKPMIAEAKSAGQFRTEHYPAFDRLQIITVQDILDGNRMNLPLMEEVTKRAQRAKADAQIGLNFE